MLRSMLRAAIILLAALVAVVPAIAQPHVHTGELAPGAHRVHLHVMPHGDGHEHGGHAHGHVHDHEATPGAPTGDGTGDHAPDDSEHWTARDLTPQAPGKTVFHAPAPIWVVLGTVLAPPEPEREITWPLWGAPSRASPPPRTLSPRAPPLAS